MAVTREDELVGERQRASRLGKVARFPVQYYRRIPAPVRLLSAGVFINRAGGFVVVFLPLILAIRHTPTTEIGIALILSGGFAIAGSWLGGALIARLGIRRTIFLSMAGSAVFTAFLAFSVSYWVTVANVSLIALFSRAYSPAGATLVGRVSPPDQRIQMFAFFQLCLNFGASIGPAIAGYLLTRSLVALLLIDAATSAVFAVIGLRIPADARLPDRRVQHPRHISPGSNPPASQAADFSNRADRLRSDRGFLTFCVAVALTCLVFRQADGPFLLVFKYRHYSYTLLGDLLTGHAIAVLVFQLPLSYLTRRLPVWIPLAVSALLICGAYPLLLAGTSVPLLIGNVAMWTAGDIIFCPICLAVASMMSTARTHGSYQGAHSVARAIGLAAGPPVGVFAYSVSPSLPWLGAGALGIVTAVLYFASLRKLPRPDASAPPARCG